MAPKKRVEKDPFVECVALKQVGSLVGGRVKPAIHLTLFPDATSNVQGVHNVLRNATEQGIKVFSYIYWQSL
jgi:hypothetical protein